LNSIHNLRLGPVRETIRFGGLDKSSDHLFPQGKVLPERPVRPPDHIGRRRGHGSNLNAGAIPMVNSGVDGGLMSVLRLAFLPLATCDATSRP
jgi:hypothetical protein